MLLCSTFKMSDFNCRDSSHTKNVVEMSNEDVALKAHK